MLAQGLQADPFQLARYRFVSLPWGLRLRFNDLPDQVLQVVGEEGFPVAEHLVEDNAEAEDVAAAIDPVSLTAGLLRGHVDGGADQGLAESDLVIAQGQTEIQDPWLVFPVDENVRWLDIAVDQALPVGMVEGGCDGGQPAGRFLKGYKLPFQAGGKILSF